MHWKRLDRNSPVDGHFLPSTSKLLVGLWKLCYSGNNSYWLISSGDKITRFHTDNWCDVEDIISAVEDIKYRIVASSIVNYQYLYE